MDEDDRGDHENAIREEAEMMDAEAARAEHTPPTDAELDSRWHCRYCDTANPRWRRYCFQCLAPSLSNKELWRLAGIKFSEAATVLDGDGGWPMTTRGLRAVWNEAGRASVAGPKVITIDVTTGQWITRAAITRDEGATVAAAVLPGITPDQVKAWYDSVTATWDAEPKPDPEVACLREQLAERDADDLHRSEEGRTDWDYEQRIARLRAVIAEARQLAWGGNVKGIVEAHDALDQVHQVLAAASADRPDTREVE